MDPSSRPSAESAAPLAARSVALVVVVAACWAVLRLAMNREYGPASWASLVELRAPLPFGHRVLVPWLVRPFVDAGVPVGWAFGVSEWLATIALIVGLHRAIARDLPARAAALGAVLVLPILAFPMLLAHRWNVLYPWDTWAMFALVVAIDAIRRDRMGLACVVVFVAAFNRESIALVPLCAVVLRLDRGAVRTTAAWAVWMGFAYVGARMLVAALVPDARGAALHVWLGDEPRLLANLRWLGHDAHAVQWLGSVAALPVAWWLVRRFAPRDLMRLHVPALIGGFGLAVVANVYEPRVYGELAVVAWWVVWTGAWRWASGEAPGTDPGGWPGRFDRFAAIAITIAAVAMGFVAVWSAHLRRP